MEALAVDLRDLAGLREELAVAGEALAEADALDPRTADLLRSVAVELANADPGEWAEGIDPYQLIELQQAGLSALLGLAADDERERVEAAEIALESLQDVIADIEAGTAVGDERPGYEIVAWLRGCTAMSNGELAGLLGVSKRKLDRWIAGDSEPAGEDAIRLRVAARVVNQLRHSMTAAGAVRWLERPFADLGGRSPSELLGSAELAPRLFALAARSRRSDAT